MNKQLLLLALLLIPLPLFCKTAALTLEEQVDAAIRKPGNITPLHAYAYLGGLKKFRTQAIAAAEELIKSGANVNARRSDGATPLLIAIDQNIPKLAAMLLNAGADPNMPLISNKELDELKIVPDTVNFDIPLKEYSALHIAGFAEHCNMTADFSHCIKMLYETGANDTTLNQETREKCHRYHPAGQSRKLARKKNLDFQLTLLQRICNNKIPITDLLRIIHEYVGLDYTFDDKVPLTTMGGPASAPSKCTIEEIS